MNLLLEIFQWIGIGLLVLVFLPIPLAGVVKAITYLNEQRMWDRKVTDLPNPSTMTFREARELSAALYNIEDVYNTTERLRTKANEVPAPATVSSPYAISDDQLIELPTGGMVRFGDIPKDPKTGLIDPAWLEKNCPCPEHGGKGKVPDTPDGMFL